MADPNAPEHSEGFGPAEDSDASRQAQHQNANDTPADVNPNAIYARTQAAMMGGQMETMVQMGKNFEAAATRRQAMFDHMAAVLMKTP